MTVFSISQAEPGFESAWRSSARGRDVGRRPHGQRWAEWERSGEAYTVGVEEEIMLIDPLDGSPAQRGDEVVRHLSAAPPGHIAQETHAGVIELATGVHREVAGSVAELAVMRERLAAELTPMGMACACAGTHPLARDDQTRVSGGGRYQRLADSMRSLAHRTPTMALHVHIGVPEPANAIRVLNRLREHLPVMLALAANSPYCRGRDSGFQSMRTMIFRGFPRTGAPRAFTSYADYVETLEMLISSRAIPDPTFLWWDARLQPALGTVEVRVMDAQTTLDDSAPLIALVQSLVHSELEGAEHRVWSPPEILEENCFLAARDGINAELINPSGRRQVPLSWLAEDLLDSCRPHAEALGCQAELEGIRRLIAGNGARSQRQWTAAGHEVSSLLPELARRFASRRSHPRPVAALERST